MIGLYALIFGFSSPGIGAEAFGLVALALGLIGLGFNVNLGAIFLLLLGLGLILAELHSHSFGILAVAGLSLRDRGQHTLRAHQLSAVVRAGRLPAIPGPGHHPPIPHPGRLPGLRHLQDSPASASPRPSPDAWWARRRRLWTGWTRTGMCSSMASTGRRRRKARWRRGRGW